MKADGAAQERFQSAVTLSVTNARKCRVTGCTSAHRRILGGDWINPRIC
jgi:hypothetical protein